MMPEPAFRRWAPVTLIIDALLVRAAHYGRSQSDREHAAAFEKLEDLLGNPWIGADIRRIGPPVTQFVSVLVLAENDPHGNFGGVVAIGSVKPVLGSTRH